MLEIAAPLLAQQVFQADSTTDINLIFAAQLINDVIFWIPTLTVAGIFLYYYETGASNPLYSTTVLLSNYTFGLYWPILCLVFVPSAINLTSIPQTAGIALMYYYINYLSSDVNVDPTSSFISTLFYWIPVVTTLIQVLLALVGSGFWLYIALSGTYTSTGSLFSTQSILSILGVVEGFLFISLLDFYPLYIMTFSYGFTL